MGKIVVTLPQVLHPGTQHVRPIVSHLTIFSLCEFFSKLDSCSSEGGVLEQTINGELYTIVVTTLPCRLRLSRQGSPLTGRTLSSSLIRLAATFRWRRE